MKKLFVSSYLILIHILLLVLIIKSDTYQEISRHWQQPKESFDRCYHNIAAFYRRVDKNVKNGSVIFIGDSLIQGMAVTSVTPNAVNFGIGEDTTLGVLARIKHYDSIETTKQLVIAIGHNDLKYRTPVIIAKNIENIILSVPRTIPITLSAILPITEQFVSYTSNAQIAQLNQHVALMASKFPNVNFININDKLMDDSGLKAIFHLGDGVHLSKKGYHVWLTSLAQTIR